MESMLGIRFLASEYPAGPWHRGRIDTLGLDENNTPVVIEVNWTAGQSVSNLVLVPARSGKVVITNHSGGSVDLLGDFEGLSLNY
ncbi:hypothetical protein ABIA32_001893 [Streptacidiphilus sp. MAP12-20]|uniref:hypothetical protein n=1 Tax=Streptacidiphilus sp. MAP12-20 TaxID=3156299 RepID=UPI0035124EDC